MYIQYLNCCAAAEITELRLHKTAKEAMQRFCKLRLRELHTFYVFTAHLYHGADYGNNFAKLIRTNKLGPVVSTGRYINRANHPTHIVKLWVWHPDKERLLQWYKKNTLKRQTKKLNPWSSEAFV